MIEHTPEEFAERYEYCLHLLDELHAALQDQKDRFEQSKNHSYYLNLGWVRGNLHQTLLVLKP